MDTIVEVLVKKKKTVLDMALQFFFVLLGVVLCYIALIFSKYLGMISYAIMFLVIWFDSRFVLSLNVEYEYTYVKGDMDIDRIFGKNTRRRYHTILLSKIECVSKWKNNRMKRIGKELKTAFACTNKNDENNICIIYSDEKGKKMVVIENDDRIFDDYKRIIPLKVEDYE